MLVHVSAMLIEARRGRRTSPGSDITGAWRGWMWVLEATQGALQGKPYLLSRSEPPPLGKGEVGGASPSLDEPTIAGRCRRLRPAHVHSVRGAACPPPLSCPVWYMLLPLAPPPPNWFPRARKSPGLAPSCPVVCNLQDASTNRSSPSACACLPGRLAPRPCPQAVGATQGGGEGRDRRRAIYWGISGWPCGR